MKFRGRLASGRHPIFDDHRDRQRLRLSGPRHRCLYTRYVKNWNYELTKDGGFCFAVIFFMSPAHLEALTLLEASFVDEAEAVYERFREDLDESGQIWSRSGSNTSTRSARATFSQVTSL